MKKLLWPLLAVLLTLCGCSNTATSLESLLSPPMRTGEQSQIYQALESSVNSSISLVYPRSGAYTSAIVVEDLDGDNVQDALVFYKEQSQSTSSATSVRMNFLVQENGEWVSTHDISLPNATEVEKMQLVREDEATLLVVGFNQSSSSEKLLKVYTYSPESGPEEKLSESCANFTVTDLDADGINDIFSISAPASGDNTAKEVTGVLFQLRGGQLGETSSVRMNAKAVEYLAIQIGWVENSSTPAIYLDSQIGVDTEATEIILCRDGALVDLMMGQTAQEDLLSATYRPTGYACLDLDGDGSYEIPTMDCAPGYTADAATQTIYYTSWLSYQGGELRETARTYTNYSYGYHFRLPESWAENVSASPNTAGDEISFFIYQGSLREQDQGQVLLKIRTYTRSDWENRSPASRYQKLGENGQLVYAYELFTTSTELDLSEETAKSLFSVLED